MPDSQLLDYVVAAVMGSAPAVLALGYFGKLLFDKLVARDAKREESALARDAKREEAELKLRTDLANALTVSNLQRRNLEHQVQFTKLHERRLEIIATLYKLITNGLRAANDFSSPIADSKNGEPVDRTVLAEKARAAVNSLESYFDEHQIYLPAHVQDQARSLVKRLDGAVFAAYVYHDDYAKIMDSAESEPGVDLTQWKEDKRASLSKTWHEVSNIGSTLRGSLESEFRKLLEPRVDA